jgi:hypothetical protein
MLEKTSFILHIYLLFEIYKLVVVVVVVKQFILYELKRKAAVRLFFFVSRNTHADYRIARTKTRTNYSYYSKS